MKINSEKSTFSKLFDVSRETLTKLIQYELKIISFNEKFNIIGKSTIPHIWKRHFADSAKILSFITTILKKKENRKLTICDVGSGAGFPGLVILILNQEKKVNFHMTLVESNKKKCSFLLLQDQRFLTLLELLNLLLPKILKITWDLYQMG